MSLISASMSATRIFLLVVSLSLTACQNAEDGWSDHQLKTIASLSLASLEDLPAVPSNRFAYDDKAASLGRELFFDTRFSLNGELSCASCHQPEKAYTDGLPKGQGIHATGRNTQGLIGAAYQNWYYWDGRKDSLWSQALVPFESANEMASSRVQVLRTVGLDPQLRRQYEVLFGEFPSTVINNRSIPDNAGPWGDSQTRNNWYRIPVATQVTINTAYANIGKAIAAYERTLPLPSTRFDVYSKMLLNPEARQAEDIFSEDEKAGLMLFIDQSRTHCMRCHNGPLFSNREFHNIGSGKFTGPKLDFGRYLGVQAVLQDEFNCLGAYSDADAVDCNALRFLPDNIHGEMQGAYKTPSLRYLDKTGPYFHDGRYATITQVLDHYLETPSVDSELPAITLTDKERRQLLAFLSTLNDLR